MTQDVGNRHHRGRGADRATLSGHAFINNARGGPGGRQGASRAAELALCFQCVRNTKELSQCETQTTGILSRGGGQTVI